MKSYLIKLVPYLLGLGILLLVCLVFLAPQLSGKTIVQGDGIQGSGMIEEAKKYHEKTGEFTYWTNSMFSGMPTYLLYGGAKACIINYFNSALYINRDDILGYFLLFAISTYIGFIFLGLGPWLSLLGAIAASFATTHIGILEAGHNTKLASSGFTILAFAGIYRLFRKDYLLGALAFSLGLTFSLANNHPQMTYYFMLGVGIFTLFFIYDFIQKKEFTALGKILIFLLVGSVVALGANLYQVITVRGFSTDTMRGGSIPSSAATRGQIKSVSESSSGGLGYDYAMLWSDGVKDLMAMLIPGAIGGSNGERVESTKV